jgi:signal transduction histidine kinase
MRAGLALAGFCLFSVSAWAVSIGVGLDRNRSWAIASLAGLLGGWMIPKLRRLGPGHAGRRPVSEGSQEALSFSLARANTKQQIATCVQDYLSKALEPSRATLNWDSESSPHSGYGSKPPTDCQATGCPTMSLPVQFGGRQLATLRVSRCHGAPQLTESQSSLLRSVANQAALALAHVDSTEELELCRHQLADAWKTGRVTLLETLAAEIAHEVRYPINFFRSIFKRGTAVGSLDAEEIEVGCDEVDRLERLVAGLRRVSTPKLDKRQVRVADLTTRAEMLLRDRLSDRRPVLALDDLSRLQCDPDRTTQVLVNLLSNAIDATSDAGEVGISWTVTPQGEGLLTVWNTGPGFDCDPSRLFVPWATTKPGGTGLGLAITHRIVQAHGWSIDAHHDRGRTQFVVTVPAADITRSVDSTRKEHAG